MKRKVLSDIECMSGTGWYPDDIEVECLECGEMISLVSPKRKYKCKECGFTFKMEYGKLHLMRVVEVDEK